MCVVCTKLPEGDINYLLILGTHIRERLCYGWETDFSLSAWQKLLTQRPWEIYWEASRVFVFDSCSALIDREESFQVLWKKE